MSLQILKPSLSEPTEAGLAKWKNYISGGIIGLPLIMACLAFTNKNGGYRLIGAFCALPVRPFWFRLTLSWIPRYIIAVLIIILTIVIRLRVKIFQQKLEQLQAAMRPVTMMEDGIIEEPEESEESLAPEVIPVAKQEKRLSMIAKRVTLQIPITLPIDPEKREEKDLENQEKGELENHDKKESENPAKKQTEKRDNRFSHKSIPPMPADQQPFGTDDARRYKRQSFKRKSMGPGAAGNNNGNMPGPHKPLPALPRVSYIAPSLAPSSAVFASPTRDTFDEQDIMFASLNNFSMQEAQGPMRRKSLFVDNVTRAPPIMEFAPRRASLVETSTPRPTNSRNLSYHGTPTTTTTTPNHSTIESRIPHHVLAHRRSSIWDEIDASLEKKVTNNRISIFTLTSNIPHGDGKEIAIIEPASSSGHNTPPSPTRESLPPTPRPRSALSRRSSAVPSFAASPPVSHLPAGPLSSNPTIPASSRPASKLYDLARRTISVISLRGTDVGVEEPTDSPAVILRRRHRYIQRQVRYMMFYPFLYLLLWLFPFISHVLQYQDRYAARPPYAIVILSHVSMTLFGFGNSVVFVLREKPWTMIQGADGTVRGSFKSDPVYMYVRKKWRRFRGRDDGEMDFVG